RMNGTEVEVQSPNVQAFKCMHNGRETYFEAYIFEYDENTSSEMLANYALFHNCYDALSQMCWATPEMCLAIKLSHRFKKNTR
ncbi:DUF7277 domain-containing protein, partial [Escherichia coli]|uniref:DUF7277 domain-containing protein n=1 Tax=Escherichia coli TaxID=562 RepID=UPI003CE49814